MPKKATVFLEAEQFSHLGGWDVDQQSMDVMGSPYVLAHGLGVPVKDCVTSHTFTGGTYRVWVRTRDWVAPWKAPGAPGRFQLLVNGHPLKETFGTQGADWHWQDGGSIVLPHGSSTIALHDLTGFEGRCDAVVFTLDPNFIPPNAPKALDAFRRKMLGLPKKDEIGGSYDLVVVGGGIAGTSAAISAARRGLKVALIQDRPVLGGNSSSEVRVWPEGATCQKPFPHVGDIVEEVAPKKVSGTGNAKGGDIYQDHKKIDVVAAEPNIHLFLGKHVIRVSAQKGKIKSVVAQDISSARRYIFKGKFFADCTGDATVGVLAGAAYEVSKEGQMGATNLWNVMDVSDPAEVIKCECKDKDALTISVNEGNVAAPFPSCPWALNLKDKPFPGRKNWNAQWKNTPMSNLGDWFWESGFDKDMVTDIERIRDLNFRAMYGAWDVLKNIDGLYPNHRLGWAAFIAGKRESRRLLGDLILTGNDFRKSVKYPDAAFPCSWHIDVHSPHPSFSKGMKGNEFIAEATESAQYQYKGPYWAPYRCLYSRNVSNLFMAGRDVSVNREALGAVRVMRTTGMMGEIVGKAAWICVSHKTTPRGVYESHLSLLHDLMQQPGSTRR